MRPVVSFHFRTCVGRLSIRWRSARGSDLKNTIAPFTNLLKRHACDGAQARAESIDSRFFEQHPRAFSGKRYLHHAHMRRAKVRVRFGFSRVLSVCRYLPGLRLAAALFAFRLGQLIREENLGTCGFRRRMFVIRCANHQLWRSRIVSCRKM